jgi:hypothetical protein
LKGLELAIEVHHVWGHVVGLQGLIVVDCLLRLRDSFPMVSIESNSGRIVWVIISRLPSVLLRIPVFLDDGRRNSMVRSTCIRIWTKPYGQISTLLRLHNLDLQVWVYRTHSPLHSRGPGTSTEPAFLLSPFSSCFCLFE